MTTREDQLKNKNNFIGKNGNLFLIRCVACGGDYGTENYALAVKYGQCAWCGWKDESQKESIK